MPNTPEMKDEMTMVSPSRAKEARVIQGMIVRVDLFPSPLWGGVGVGVGRPGAGVDDCASPPDPPPYPPPQGGGKNYAERASAPSIMSTVFCTPYTATNEPKRGPFSWPSSTW